MRKILFSGLLFFIWGMSANATIHTVEVSNFQFSPAVLNANVGDTVRWTWIAGFHTTTSTSVPSGAASWNNPMTSGNTSFDYQLTVAGSYEYLCQPHASFMVASINVGGALPLKFGAIAISENKPGFVEIEWEALSEENVYKYNVLRSSDGIRFTEIGSVAANREVIPVKKYEYTDLRTVANQAFFYYYIEGVDRDGRKTLSPVKLHKAGTTVSNQIIRSLSPNPLPANGHLKLSFNAEENGTLYLNLVDNNGRIVERTQMQAKTGINNGHWHLHSMSPGKYYIQSSLGNKRETTEIMVIQ